MESERGGGADKKKKKKKKKACKRFKLKKMETL